MIPGHTLETENRRVTKWSSSFNSDYEGSDRYLVCSCGFEEKVYSGKDEFRTSVEHCLDVLGKEVLG